MLQMKIRNKIPNRNYKYWPDPLRKSLIQRTPSPSLIEFDRRGLQSTQTNKQTKLKRKNDIWITLSHWSHAVLIKVVND